MDVSDLPNPAVPQAVFLVASQRPKTALCAIDGDLDFISVRDLELRGSGDVFKGKTVQYFQTLRLPI